MLLEQKQTLDHICRTESHTLEQVVPTPILPKAVNKYGGFLMFLAHVPQSFLKAVFPE